VCCFGVPTTVVPLRHRGDEFFNALSPLLEEALPDEGAPRQGIRNVLSLREENARLRALAIKLSNLVGDLPISRVGGCRSGVR